MICFAVGLCNILTRGSTGSCGVRFDIQQGDLTKLTRSHSESGFVHVSELQRKFSYLLAVYMQLYTGV